MADADALADGELLVLGVLEVVDDVVAGGGDIGIFLGVFIGYLKQPAVILVDINALFVYLYLVANLESAAICAIKDTGR